jgi:hypothetical protein
MSNPRPIQHFFDAVDRAHKHQKLVVMALTLSIEGQKETDPLTVEFELLPPMDKTTDKTKRNHKK